MASLEPDYFEPVDEHPPGLRPRPNYKAVVARHFQAASLVGLLILILGVALAFGLPAVFRSEAIILIEQQGIPQDLIRSTVTGFADQRVEMIRQRVMSSTNLLKIIERFDLYADDRKRQPREVILDQMRDAIDQQMISADVVDPLSGRPTTATIAFSLAFESESASTAQKVANELVSLFLQENIKNRSESASDTSSFLTEEANRLNDAIAILEKQLAKFKEFNADSLPELQQLTLQMLDRTESQRQEVDRQLASLAEQRIFMEGQLAQISPHDQLISETGERIMGPSDRLKALETILISLQANYTESHPQVVRTQREIEALKLKLGGVDIGADLTARLEDLKAQYQVASQRYSADHPQITKLTKLIIELENSVMDQSESPSAHQQPKPDNPIYIDMQSRLQTITANEHSYLAKKEELDQRINQYETALQKTPQVERNYRQLVRDYDNALLKYREIRAKQMEAQLAESLETGRKGERFALIEPPLLPEEPVRPNRPVLLLLSLIFALSAFAGTVLLREKSDPSIRTAAELEAFMGEIPLATIPIITTIAETSRKKTIRFRFILGAFSLVVAMLLLFHFFILPLDVAWFVAMRRLGI